MNVGNAPDRALALVAARQHGLFSREQARAAGFTDARVHRRLRDGAWIRVSRGVYRIAGAPVTWQQRALAACLIAGPAAAVSHGAAAVIHGVAGFRPGRVAITVPPVYSARNPIATVHRSGLLLPRDRTKVDRIPVTHPARMLCDIAGEVSVSKLEDGVDDVLCRKLTSLDRLIADSEAASGRRGIANLRRVLDAWDGDSDDSVLAEMRLIRELVARGLPRPVRQFEIWVNGKLVARIDLAFLRWKLGIELDSFRWHAARRAFRKDRQRANRVAALGWQLLRATTEDAHDSRELVEAAAAMILAAA